MGKFNKGSSSVSQSRVGKDDLRVGQPIKVEIFIRKNCNYNGSSRATSLQHLNIGGTFITDSSLTAIAESCPHLKGRLVLFAFFERSNVRSLVSDQIPPENLGFPEKRLFDKLRS